MNDSNSENQGSYTEYVNRGSVAKGGASGLREDLSNSRVVVERVYLNFAARVKEAKRKLRLSRQEGN